MASLVTRLVLAMVVIAGTLMFGNVQVSAQCGGSIPQLVAQCSQFVKKEGPKIPPSPGCCSVVKAADVPCVCTLVTPAIEKLISMEKVVYVARTCGVTVKPGTKCGSEFLRWNPNQTSSTMCVYMYVFIIYLCIFFLKSWFRYFRLHGSTKKNDIRSRCWLELQKTKCCYINFPLNNEKCDHFFCMLL